MPATLEKPLAAPPFPEPLGILYASDVSQGADAQSQKSPGTVVSAEAEGENVVWSEPGNAKASDDSRATATIAEFKPRTEYLKATNFGFALPEGATIIGIVVEVERSQTGGDENLQDEAVRIVKGGSIGGTDKASPEIWPSSDAYKSYGASDDLWGEEWLYSDINAEGFGFAIRAGENAQTGATARIDHIRITVYYTEAADPNRVCFAGRSIEFRSDGIYRQHPTDDVWGLLVPDGFLPHAAPSGAEGRATRAILIPSQGDLGELADSGSNPLEAQTFVRPAFHFAREAS